MIVFRQVTDEDVPVLEEIRRAVFCDGEELAVTGWEEAAPRAGWTCVVDGRPAGFAVADRSRGEVEVTAVLPEQQGKGRGRELMRQAEGWLFSHGWEEIRLRLPAEHSAAAGFYRRLGWGDEGDGDFLRKANPGPVFALEEHVVADDAATGYRRRVRLQRGPAERPHRLCVLLDGELYWRDVAVVGMLNALVESGAIPAMTFAFVGHVSGAARQADFVCNEGYARFIGERVVAWAREEVPSLQEEGGHLIVGLSLSGLMAVFTALLFPQSFGSCLSQSGSHWWEHARFAERVRQRAPVAGRFWLSVGDKEGQVRVQHSPTLFQEISQIAGVEKAARVLEAAGAAVRCHRFRGGHSHQCWRDELGAALGWLVGEGDREKE